jgi:F0F1-type ATP synthase assembly protein I
VTNPTDDRSPLAKAAEWVSVATTVALQMAAPPLVGVWIDRWLGTGVLFAVVGGAIGMAAGLWSLLRMTELLRRDHDKTRGQNSSQGERPHKPP